MQYGVRWEILAGINEIETDYGRNLNVSSAGALGWMQFMPATWKAYGVDANRDGVKDPFNPVDAIFAAARYLKAAGADTDIRKAVFAYNHADWYVDSVLMRAQVIGGIPGDLVGSLTGLTQGRFPVRAKATYAGALKKADRKTKGANAAVVVESDETRRNIEIFAKAGSPVIAVNDGKVLKLGANKRLGRYVIVQDVYGNTYTYAHLKTVAKTYPAPKKRTPARTRTELQAPRPASTSPRPTSRPPTRSRPSRRPRRRARPPRPSPRSACSRTRSARTREGRRRRPDRGRRDRHRRRSARPRPRRLRRQAARQGRPRPRRHDARPDRQDLRDEGAAPPVRDPPGRPRRPAHRPEADPRRLEAARVDRGLPRQGQERAVRLRRRASRRSARSCS